MHPLRGNIRRIEKFQSLGESQVGISRTERRQTDLRSLRCQDHCRCFGRWQFGEVFLIGDEGDFAGSGFINAVDSADLRFSIASQLTTETLCDVKEFHSHTCMLPHLLHSLMAFYVAESRKNDYARHAESDSGRNMRAV